MVARETVARWMAVGRSNLDDPFAAGRAAASEALAGGDDPRLLIVFSADRFDGAALLAGIRSSAALVPLIGCTTAGEIARSGPGEIGVVVTALGGPGFTVATRASRQASTDLRAAGGKGARRVRARPRPRDRLFRAGAGR